MRVKMERADLGETGKKSEVKLLTIIIVDNSGSMSGAKYNNALEGLHKLVKDIKENETIKLIQFSDNINADITINPGDISSFEEIKKALNKSMGSTALYDTIVAVNTEYIVPCKDKILVNVFTDGEDNHSGYTASHVNEIIKQLESQGNTFTFLGTTADKNMIKRTLKVDDSNLFTYTNTARGVETAFTKTLTSRATYMSKLSAGEDVSLGFYSKVLED